MAESFELTVARKIDRLERALRESAARHTAGYTFADVLGTLQGFPELRGLWPFSSVNESGQALDFSEQGRTLTNNNAAPRALANNIVPYVGLNGTNQSFSRADEAGLDITGALTFGGWFFVTGTTAQALVAKMGASGAYAYQLVVLDASTLAFDVSANGTALYRLTYTVDVPVNDWFFLAGRFTPSSESALFFNDQKTTRTDSVPAAIFNTAAAFRIGANDGGGFTGGRVALPFLCASAVPDVLLRRVFSISRTLLGV